MLRCKECTFHKQSCAGFVSTNFTEGSGPKDSGVMLIYDSPFHSDVTAESIGTNKEYNNYLNNHLKQIGLNTESIYVTSFIKCFISDKKKKPTKPMKMKCVEAHLDKEIREVKPKVIILIGRMVTQYFIPEVTAKVPLKQVIGKSFYNGEYQCYVVPVYDMYYLTNFSDKSSQMRQTGKAFAQVRTHLGGDEVKANRPKITYSHNLADVTKLGEYVTVDVETTGLNPRKDKILTIGVSDGKLHTSFDFMAYKDDKSEVIENEDGTFTVKGFKEFYGKVLPFIIKELLKRKLVGHNMLFDLTMILAEGYDLTDNMVADTRLMQFLINPNGANALGFLIQLYYGIAYKEDIDRSQIIKMEMEDRRYYCAEDVYYTHKLFLDLFKVVKAQDSLISNKILTDVIRNLVFLETKGIRADEKIITELIEFYLQERGACEAKFKKRFKLSEEFNLNSPKQLCKLLYEDLELPILVRTKTRNKDTGEYNPSTNEEAITKLAEKRPALGVLVDYRTNKGHIEKLKGYQAAIAEDGRIHSSFNVFSPDSSRLMSSKPNIQNVPRKSRLKEVFVPAPGYSYIYYDYSQIEFRVWIHLSRDTKGIEFINAGRDIHAFIASQFYRMPEAYFLDKENEDGKEKRNRVKAIVYGSMYGRTPEGIVREHGGSVDDAAAIQAIFFSLCKKGWFWLQQIEQEILKTKKLRTPFGTYRYFNDIELATPKEKEELIRQAKSFIVQSWAAELGFLGISKVCRKIRAEKLDATWIHNIHDANKFETLDAHIEPVKKIILSEAQSPYAKMSVPLTVDIKVGKSWAEVA